MVHPHTDKPYRYKYHNTLCIMQLFAIFISFQINIQVGNTKLTDYFIEFSDIKLVIFHGHGQSSYKIDHLHEMAIPSKT